MNENEWMNETDLARKDLQSVCVCVCVCACVCLCVFVRQLELFMPLRDLKLSCWIINTNIYIKTDLKTKENNQGGEARDRGYQPTGEILDMEGRMRRSKIQILNVPETPDSSTPAGVSNLLKVVENGQTSWSTDHTGVYGQGDQTINPVSSGPKCITVKTVLTFFAVPGNPADRYSSKEPPSPFSQITPQVLYRPDPLSMR